MKNMRNQVIETLELLLKEAYERNNDQQEIGDIVGLLEYTRQDQSENYYIRDAHLLREVLQSLDLTWDFVPPGGCSLTQVYEYLDPIVREYERMADEGQQAFEFKEE